MVRAIILPEVKKLKIRKETKEIKDIREKDKSLERKKYMINEKELIEEIENFNMTSEGFGPEKKLQEYIEEYKREIIDIIKKQPRLDRWISLEERMPKPGQHIFVKYYDVNYYDENDNPIYNDYYFIDEARYYEDDKGYFWHEPNDDQPIAGGDEDLIIIGWMPYFLE